MSKTLDDLADELGKSNDLQKETNEHLQELTEMFAKQFGYEKAQDQKEARESRRTRGKRRSEAKFQRERSDDVNIVGALASGDWLRALFGLPVAGAAILSIIIGVAKISQTFQEFFRDGEKAAVEVSERWRAFIAATAGFMNFMRAFFGSFTVLYRIAKTLPAIGAVVKGIEGIFRGLFALSEPVRKILRYFTGIHTLRGIFSVLGKFFNVILIIDSAIRGVLGGLRKWGELEGIHWGKRLFISVGHGLGVAVQTFIKAFVDAIPLLFSAINWVFDDLMRYVENSGIPIVSQLASVVRNVYLWLGELATSINETFNITGRIKQFIARMNGWVSEWNIDADQVLSSMYDMGAVVVKSIIHSISSIFKWVLDGVKSASPDSVVGFFREKAKEAMESIRNFFANVMETFKKQMKRWGVEWPDRWPWQRSPEQKRKDEERNMQRSQKEDRVDEIERKQAERDRVEKRQAATSPLIMDNSSVDNSVIQQSSIEIGQAARPYDDHHPGKIPQTAYAY